MSAAARSLEYLARSNPGAASEDHRSCRPLPPDSGTANMHRRAGHPYLCRLWSDTLGHGGLDLRTTMFAPCLLGCPHSWRKRRSANQSSIRAAPARSPRLCRGSRAFSPAQLGRTALATREPEACHGKCGVVCPLGHL
jgi:hypothetical protein